jgi:hypothetical protein
MISAVRHLIVFGKVVEIDLRGTTSFFKLTAANVRLEILSDFGVYLTMFVQDI